MIFYAPILILIVAVSALEPNIDINRVRLLHDKAFHDHNYHDRRSVPDGIQIRSNDYNDYSHIEVYRPWLFPSTKKASTSKIPVKVYQPREDPRLFYQSDAYRKEISRKNVNHEVTHIYPGKNTILASDGAHRPSAIRWKARELTRDDSYCIRCPRDRTVVARSGEDQVILQTPKLITCSGQRAPRNYHFAHMYGPDFDSLLGQGSYMIIGKIMHNNQSLHLCKIQVHVVVQECRVPKYLITHCEHSKHACNFTCWNPKLDLHGQSSLSCGRNMKWSGDLPVCRARTWCEPLSPPDQGSLSCKGVTIPEGRGFTEGSRCRVRCLHGYRGYPPRSVAVCRRGAWTNKLDCQTSVKFRKT